MGKSNTKSSKNYLVSAVFGVIVIAIVQKWWPGLIPWATFDLWTPKGTLGEWLRVAWPVFAWGCGLNLVIQIINWIGNSSPKTGILRTVLRLQNPSPAQILGGGTLISIWEGVVEEISFRWLIFYATIGTVTLGNFLFFGWLGFGFQEWFHMNVWGPFADWTTLGCLKEYIFFPTGDSDTTLSWAVGAAMLSTNAFFRDGHKYQGPLGIINSWFMGMYFFWLSFRFGLPAAIAVHFAYDFLIFATVAVMTALRERRIF